MNNILLAAAVCSLSAALMTYCISLVRVEREKTLRQAMRYGRGKKPKRSA